MISLSAGEFLKEGKGIEYKIPSQLFGLAAWVILGSSLLNNNILVFLLAEPDVMNLGNIIDEDLSTLLKGLKIIE